MKTFFTGDTHFGHKRILEYCPTTRLYDTIEEHDETLIKRWNSVVSPEDHVYHVGDVSFSDHGRTIEIFRQLNGKVSLILGNHDKGIVKALPYLPNIIEVVSYKEIKLNNNTIILFHFPIESWNKVHYGSIHLHGHTHGALSHHPTNKKARRMDVGVDCHKDNAPFSIKEILAYLGEA